MPLEVVTHQVDGKLAAAEAIVCPLTTFKCGQTVLDLTYVRPSSSGRACKKTFFFFLAVADGGTTRRQLYTCTLQCRRILAVADAVIVHLGYCIAHITAFAL